ncbi:MAG: hypothetical protein CSA35_03660 [Dethiosulfovibrio peptidovorans]|nr:MAG: hypothetical protein CSA35_03660 [Dethiosulfovibrio peptidovorans]
MSARERIAYVKGLLKGRPPEDEYDRVLYGAIVHALDALADQLDEQADSLVIATEDLEDLADYCEDLGEELESLEDIWSQQLYATDEGSGEMEEAPCRSIICPACSTVFYCCSEIFEDGEMIQCPGCKRSFLPSEVELEEE